MQRTLVLAILAVALLAAALPAAGALAVGSVPDGRFAWAARDRTDFSRPTTVDEIEDAALAQCDKTAATAKASADACKIVLRYDDQCFAIAASQPSGHRIGWAKADQVDEARRQAREVCAANAHAINETCEILGAFCDR